MPLVENLRDPAAGEAVEHHDGDGGAVREVEEVEHGGDDHKVAAGVFQAADGGVTHLSPTARGVYRELGAGAEVDGVIQATDSQLRHGVREGGELKLAGYDQVVTFAFVEMGIFFSILLVAFAYVWRQGALDWIRAESAPPVKVDVDRVSSGRGPHESVLSA